MSECCCAPAGAGSDAGIPRRLWQGMLMHGAAALRWQPAGCWLLWGWQRWSREKLRRGGWSLWGAAGPWGGLGVLSRSSFLLLLSAVACGPLTLLQPAASLPCTAHSQRPIPAPLGCCDLSQVPAALPGRVVINYLPLWAVRGTRLPLFVLTELL